MGSKSGESRCLIDAAEREWKMALPDPVPLSLLEGCSCLQLRNATLGFPSHSSPLSAESLSSSSTTGTAAAALPTPVMKTTTAPTPTSVSSGSLGSKKIRAVPVNSTTATLPKQEYTTVLEGVTLDAHQKSKIAILGKNGCGKR